MAKRKPANDGKRWTPPDTKKLRDLAHGNTPTPLIANTLHRSENAVRGHASEKGISLRPTNKSPYNRRKGK